MLTFETLPHTLDEDGLSLVIRRSPIRGGWLVMLQRKGAGPPDPTAPDALPSLTFVPDPGHRWDGASSWLNRPSPTIPDHADPDTPVDLVLEDRGDNMVVTIKVLRRVTGWTLRRCRDAMDRLPLTVLTDCPHIEAKMVKLELEEGGARVRIRFPGP